MTRRAESKESLRDEWGTANRKKIDKIKEEEALVKAAETGRMAEEQERKVGDVEFMAAKQDEARQAAVADLVRAPAAGDQEALARAALGPGDPRRIAEAGRQATRGAHEAVTEAAAEKGLQAGQDALAAEQAMLSQLRERQNALLATAGEPPVPFAEQVGQRLAEDALRGTPSDRREDTGALAAGAEMVTPGEESSALKKFGSAIGNAYGAA